MNVLELKTWSERQQLLVIILLVGVLIGVLSFSLLYPINRECRDLATRIEDMKAQLQRKGLLRDEETLRRMLQQEEDTYRSLLEEWKATTERLAAFPNQKQLAATPVSYIEFKVALSNTRQRLARASETAEIRIPFDLGMTETVDSDQNPRHLLIQLRTVERIVDLLLALKVVAIRDVRPMPPVVHTAGEGGEEFLEEYPVLVEFNGTLENLYDLFNAVLEPEHVFFLKNLRVESATSSEKPDMLKIKAVLSVPLFFKDPSELKPLPRKTVWRSGPRGA